jgi:hypothetical protein
MRLNSDVSLSEESALSAGAEVARPSTFEAVVVELGIGWALVSVLLEGLVCSWLILLARDLPLSLENRSEDESNIEVECGG